NTTGVTFGDFYGVGGAYFGSMFDDSISATLAGRPLPAVDSLTQTKTDNNITSNIITDYSDGFTLLLAATSNSAVPSNIAVRADGYINLSSGKGILTNQSMPVLDLELASKYYIDRRIDTLANSDSNKVPITGTTADLPVVGNLFIDVTGNSTSLTNVLAFKGINQVDISSDTPVHFLDGIGSSTHQRVYAASTTWTGALPSTGPEVYELVNKEYLKAYGISITSGSSGFVTAGGAGINEEATPQIIYGEKTFNSLITINSLSGETGLSLISGANTTNISFDEGSGNLTLDSQKPIVLVRETDILLDPAGALVTKASMEAAIEAQLPGFNSKSRLGMFTSPGVSGCAEYGYSVLGNLVTFWCKTTTMPYPASGQVSGDAWNPEQDIYFPAGLFSDIFSVQAQIINNNTTGNYAQDVWIQVLDGFTSNKVRIKFQGSNTAGTSLGYSASLLVTGYLGAGLGSLPVGSL
ncbi:MAG: hypothetical protein JHC33_07025, partial [Ignisphaera sp.]|nr:hypothetical protein [Ignisphaera sp.]